MISIDRYIGIYSAHCLLPDLCDKLAEIVGSRSAVAPDRLYPLRIGNVFEKSVIIVVDELALPTLAKTLDRRVHIDNGGDGI